MQMILLLLVESEEKLKYLDEHEMGEWKIWPETQYSKN